MYLSSQAGIAVYSKPVLTMRYAAGPAIRNNISRFEATSGKLLVVSTVLEDLQRLPYPHIQSMPRNHKL